MAPEDIQDFFENHCTWKFAKTMPQWPHWYTLRVNCDDRIFWDDIVRYIRRYGYPQAFYHKVFMRFNINGWQYWTTDGSLLEQNLINRAKLGTETRYDQAASDYDKMFADESSRAEESELLETLGPLNGSVLDIGCGTGLLLRHRANDIEPENYMGIDPSRSMLKILADNFPQYSQRLRAVNAESFIWKGKFDNIIAFFSASYVGDFDCFTRYWSRKGRMLLIFYAPNYSPKSHLLLERPPRFWTYSLGELRATFSGADIFEFGNYLVVLQ